MGIDPSTTSTGFGVVKTDGYAVQLIDFGIIKTSRRQTLPDRLQIIFNRISEIIQLHHPDEFAIEDLFYAEHTKSALKLGHARGVAILSAKLEGLPIAEYAPREVKLAVVGYGHASKEQVQRSIIQQLGLKDREISHDASDALAVALCHCHRVGLRRVLNY
ncbi:MAG: crossover junction endodeoxyribonuclease RuvC [Calditrichaeota bacterium]|nr:crossover junction endodeoxyribonuclease RuvC [Calditrichota bacterium]